MLFFIKGGNLCLKLSQRGVQTQTYRQHALLCKLSDRFGKRKKTFLQSSAGCVYPIITIKQSDSCHWKSCQYPGR